MIDCHDREVIGFEFALRGRAKEAERALEAACLHRFWTLRPQGGVPRLSTAPGFITPDTPKQNGVIERFFRSLKEECVWQHQFDNFADAQQRRRAWLTWYNTGRPHQALGYRSPMQFRAAHLVQVAS